MNFKTTAVLLVLLLAVGGYVLFTHDSNPPSTETPKPPPTPSVLDVKSSDVTAVTIAGADGKPVVAADKVAGNWRLTAPVAAPADAGKVSSLVEELTSLKPTSTVAATAAVGIDHPQYTVTLVAAGKTSTLLVGDRLGMGDGLYVQAAKADTVAIVSPYLLDTLARPASDLRNSQLFNVTSADVKQLTITHADGGKVQLAKEGTTWKIVAPTAVAADESAVSELLYAVTGLTASGFVDDKSQATGLAHPTVVVSFNTAAPTTAPTTGPTTGPAPTVITLGSYDNVQKKNVYASTSDGTVVKVSASTLESLNKSALDLRDKAVVDVDPAKLTAVSIAVETTATTQPTTRPASTKTVLLTHRPAKPPVLGPVKPTTGPTSAPTTKPSTEWTVDGVDADDAKVAALLAQFHPLRAEKFLAASAIKTPDRRFAITLTSNGAPPVVVHIDDPGHDLTPVGTANGLTFNLPATLATDVTGDLKKPATP